MHHHALEHPTSRARVRVADGDESTIMRYALTGFRHADLDHLPADLADRPYAGGTTRAPSLRRRRRTRRRSRRRSTVRHGRPL